MRIIGKAGTSARKVQAVASGALSTGDTVVVNADGTVSVVEEVPVSQGAGSPVVFESAASTYTAATYDPSTQKVVIAYNESLSGKAVVGTVSGTSISFGSPVVFESAGSYWISATYDVTAQKVVIAYRDSGNSNYGTAIVGAVSGTSISFGTPVVFESGTTDYISATYDANAQKVVIAYRDASNLDYGSAVVGTVSGTSISFGSIARFATADSDFISVTYDSNAQKVVIAYSNDSSSSNGTAIVGTVSGTTISFGSPVVFQSSNIIYISITYDSNAQKVVIAYTDANNSFYGTAVVGDVSGTSISFGSPVVFESADSRFASATYDATAQKVAIAYRDNGNAGRGTAIVGTVSGTSISFDSPIVVETGAIESTAATYDSSAKKVILAYADMSNERYGTSVVFQPLSTATNLTASNYIGIASNGYADAQAATINAKGFVDDNRTGLTAGQSYYVQSDGTLSTTAGDPSVFAGTAVSATKLIVKG